MSEKPLFDPTKRPPESEHKLIPGSEARFLGSGESPEHERIRNLIESWLRDFPVDEKKRNEITRDIQSADRLSSKLFELFLYKAFSRSGIDVVVDPKLPAGHPSNPDYLLRLGGTEVCVEARFLDYGLPRTVVGEGRNLVLGYLMKNLGTRGFYLSLDVLSQSPTNPKLKGIKEGIERQLEAVQDDEGEIVQWQDNTGWAVSVRYNRLPSPEARAITTKPIMMRFPDNSELVRTGIQGKRGQHPGLGDRMSYAIGVEERAATVNGFMQACYGTPEVEGLEGHPLWGGPNPSSAPLVFGAIGAGLATFPKAHLFCLHSPASDLPLVPNFENYRWDVDLPVRVSEGVPASELLDISEFWPYE